MVPNVAVVRLPQFTGVDAVMTSEMSITTPAVFQPVGAAAPKLSTVAAEYFDLCRKYWNVSPCLKPARAHLFKLLHPGFEKHPDLRVRLMHAPNVEEMERTAVALAETGWEDEYMALSQEEQLEGSWYYRHRRQAQIALDSAADDTPEARLAKRLKKIESASNMSCVSLRPFIVMCGVSSVASSWSRRSKVGVRTSQG